jgi:hypothetical protein
MLATHFGWPGGILIPCRRLSAVIKYVILSAGHLIPTSYRGLEYFIEYEETRSVCVSAILQEQAGHLLQVRA